MTVFDAGRGGAATAASAGMIAPLYEAYGPEPRLELGLVARRGYEDWVRAIEASSGVPLGYHEQGLLVANLSSDEERRAEKAVEWIGSIGGRAEVLRGPEALAIEPTLGEARSWLWLPGEARLDTQALPRAMHGALRAAGAVFEAGESAAVAAVEVEAGRAAGVVTTAGRRLRADAVVVAAGAWSGSLEGLPRTLPVRPVRGQILRLSAGGHAPRLLLGDHAGCYVVPRDDASVLVGSTMEEAGFDNVVTDEGRSRIRDATSALIPGIETSTELDSWSGFRPLTPDGLPVLGPDPDVAGLFYATGFGRGGILIAPAAGEVLEALIMGRTPAIDIDAFRPDRF